MGMNMPEFHRRLIEASLDMCAEYGLFLAGGYAMKAHGLVDRPSKDIDFATANPLPVDQLTDRVVAGYRLCRSHESDFSLHRLVARLEAVELRNDSEFEDYGLDLEEVKRVKRFAAEWAQDINMRLLVEEEIDPDL